MDSWSSFSHANYFESDLDNITESQEYAPEMERFNLSTEELKNPEQIYGEYAEIFPSIRLYSGTTTILAGYNGSGKSTLSLQIAHTMALYGYQSFILSPEMPPKVTAHILARQATNVVDPSEQEWKFAADHVKRNFLISTAQDRITPSRAIQQLDEAYKQGCGFFIIDSLTCVRTGHELYEQAEFSDELRNWSRNHPYAYLLVLAHMRKPSGYTGGMVSRYDIRGAGEISDLAGHIWLLSRKNPFSQQDKAIFGDYDAKLVVDKNRATGNLSCKMLRFSNAQKLFHTSGRPPRYIDYLDQKPKATNANVERIY